jgi:hypothetical protein
MKLRRGRGRAVEPIDKSALDGMPTGALLARLKRLRWCEELRAASDMTDAEIEAVTGMILFKDTELWRAAYRDLKDVLATREHVHRSNDD